MTHSGLNPRRTSADRTAGALNRAVEPIAPGISRAISALLTAGSK